MIQNYNSKMYAIWYIMLQHVYSRRSIKSLCYKIAFHVPYLYYTCRLCLGSIRKLSPHERWFPPFDLILNWMENSLHSMYIIALYSSFLIRVINCDLYCDVTRTPDGEFYAKWIGCVSNAPFEHRQIGII